jgi:geranylgeranyl pyrophosphate synthase
MTKEWINERLSALVPEKDSLSEAMRYTLLAPGKRIRPLLVVAAAATFDVKEEVALDPACAIEMIHAYSLIHDDLPCMDDDDLRRGRPTLHRVFPEAIALLAGDALLTEAFRVIGEAPGISGEIKNRLIICLASRAGKEGMAGGQAIDMLSSTTPAGLSISPALLLSMIGQKTGDLFSASLEFGAILGERDPQPMRALGLDLGLAFQIRDDLEDGDGSVSILGIDAAKALLQDYLIKIEEGLAELPRGAPQVLSLLRALFPATCSHKSISILS